MIYHISNSYSVLWCQIGWQTEKTDSMQLNLTIYHTPITIIFAFRVNPYDIMQFNHNYF